MKGWIAYLWQALAAVDDDAVRHTAQQQQEAAREHHVDTNDREAVRAEFRAIIAREWGNQTR